MIAWLWCCRACRELQLLQDLWQKQPSRTTCARIQYPVSWSARALLNPLRRWLEILSRSSASWTLLQHADIFLRPCGHPPYAMLRRIIRPSIATSRLDAKGEARQDTGNDGANAVCFGPECSKDVFVGKTQHRTLPADAWAAHEAGMYTRPHRQQVAIPRLICARNLDWWGLLNEPGTHRSLRNTLGRTPPLLSWWPLLHIMWSLSM